MCLLAFRRRRHWTIVLVKNLGAPRRKAGKLAFIVLRCYSLAVELTCPKCGWSNIRPSAPNSVADRVVGTLGFAPFRCRTCRYRFFRLRLATRRLRKLTDRRTYGGASTSAHDSQRIRNPRQHLLGNPARSRLSSGRIHVPLGKFAGRSALRRIVLLTAGLLQEEYNLGPQSWDDRRVAPCSCPG